MPTNLSLVQLLRSDQPDRVRLRNRQSPFHNNPPQPATTLYQVYHGHAQKRQLIKHIVHGSMRRQSILDCVGICPDPAVASQSHKIHNKRHPVLQGGTEWHLYYSNSKFQFRVLGFVCFMPTSTSCSILQSLYYRFVHAFVFHVTSIWVNCDLRLQRMTKSERERDQVREWSIHSTRHTHDSSSLPCPTDRTFLRWLWCSVLCLASLCAWPLSFLGGNAYDCHLLPKGNPQKENCLDHSRLSSPFSFLQ